MSKWFSSRWFLPGKNDKPVWSTIHHILPVCWFTGGKPVVVNRPVSKGHICCHVITHIHENPSFISIYIIDLPSINFLLHAFSSQPSLITRRYSHQQTHVCWFKSIFLIISHHELLWSYEFHKTTNIRCSRHHNIFCTQLNSARPRGREHQHPPCMAHADGEGTGLQRCQAGRDITVLPPQGGSLHRPEAFCSWRSWICIS